MQQICKQIRESKPKRNPAPNNHAYVAHSEKPNPAIVQPLNLTDLVAPENLKASSNNRIKSCAKRECRCEFATSRKPPLKLRHVEKENKKRNRALGFMPLPDLQEQQQEEDLASDENHMSSHRWNSDSFSFAKYCEAKLEDLFKSDSNTCNESPDARRTEACFQVLEELCQNKLPFSSVLRHICDELRRATYYHISQDSSNSASGMQEKAYFEMARELEGEIAQMEAENSAWQSRLSAQSHDLMVTRGELQELGDELTNAEGASNELEEKLSLTVQALGFEKNKVNGLHEKIKKLKKELKEIRHEVKHAQQIETLKDKELDEYEKLKALYMQLVHEFQHAQAFLHSSQCEVAESASKKDLIAAKAEILELEEKISQARAQVDAFVYETRSLTPRPQWGRQVPGMDKPPGLSTAQQIEKICRENAFLAASASRLQIDFAATEVALAEIQGAEKNKTKSEKKSNPISNSNPKKAKGQSKPKEKAEK